VGGGDCDFIRLVSIGRSHTKDGQTWIKGWEIFGSLIGQIADSSYAAFTFAFARGGSRAPVGAPKPSSYPPMPSPPLAGPPLRNGTMGTRADSAIPRVAADFSFHLSLCSCGVIGPSVSRLQPPVDNLPRTCAQPHVGQSFANWSTAIFSFRSIVRNLFALL
jgi:hypothetical protein